MKEDNFPPPIDDKDLAEEVCNNVYNQAIDHAIETVKNMDQNWPFRDDQDGEWVVSVQDLISKLTNLKK